MGRWFGGRGKKIYIGEFLNSMSHGQGELRMSSGDRYVGGFARDRYDRFGIYYRVDGRTREGVYTQSQINGQGRISFPDGSFMVGYFVENELEGEVTFTSRTGETEQRRYRRGT